MGNKLKKCRTCNGCRVSYFHHSGYTCEKGYDVDYSKGIPKEPCPKPTTISQLMNTEHKTIIVGVKND